MRSFRRDSSSPEPRLRAALKGLESEALTKRRTPSVSELHAKWNAPRLNQRAQLTCPRWQGSANCIKSLCTASASRTSRESVNARSLFNLLSPRQTKNQNKQRALTVFNRSPKWTATSNNLSEMCTLRCRLRVNQPRLSESTIWWHKYKPTFLI